MSEPKDRTQDRLVWLGDAKNAILNWWKSTDHPFQDPWCTVIAAMDAMTKTAPTADAVPIAYHDRCVETEIKRREELEEQIPRWISTAERLPEEDGWYVIAQQFYNPIVTEYKAEWGWYYGQGDDIYWLPIPTPPKEVD
nr:MAG TPA: Protein of unknown function (DUF551) [Caudoviricetes sp.]